MMSPVAHNAYQGIDRAFADAGRAAETLAAVLAARETAGASRLGLRGDQTVRAAVDLMRARIAAKANAKSMKTGDQMAGSLIDILA